MKLVEWLYADQGMPAGVVNVLVDYTLDYTDGQLPKQLIEKIAGQWQRQGIHTTEAAMKKVANVLKKGKDHQKERNQNLNVRQAMRSEPIPEWFGKSKTPSLLNELDRKETDDSAAKARIEQMKRELLGGVENEKVE